MIIVDTTVIAHLLIDSDQTVAAQAVVQRDPAWFAPLLWRSEFRNVLATYIRSGRLALAQAQFAMQTAEQLMQGGELTVDSNRVLEVAAAHGHPAYDCEFVVLAQEFRVPLVTSDQRVLRVFPTVAIATAQFAAG